MNKTTNILRRTTLAAIASVALLTLDSCVQRAEVDYFQDATYGQSGQKLHNFQAVIQKNDELSVTVSSKQPDLVAPFAVTEMGDSGTSSSRQQKGYLVGSDGNIVLPVIGTIHAAGKTCAALGQEIANRLRSDDYIKDAAVNVRILNFKFSVLGEVASPGTYTADGERVTVLEAISKAGDLTINGNRDITLVREKGGKLEFVKLDLRSTRLFETPYYYLQQNDVIIVPANKKTINTRSEGMQLVGWTASGLGLLVAIVALCV